MVSTNFSSRRGGVLRQLAEGGGFLPVQQLWQFVEVCGGGDGDSRAQFTTFNHPPAKAVPLLVLLLTPFAGHRTIPKRAFPPNGGKEAEFFCCLKGKFVAGIFYWILK
jgi:hypothetical protein